MVVQSKEGKTACKLEFVSLLGSFFRLGKARVHLSSLSDSVNQKMDRWVPLLEIFLKSPSPEGEASLWMQKNPFEAAKFVPQLLCKQVFYSSSSSQTATINSKSDSALQVQSLHLFHLILHLESQRWHRCIWVQTLPNAIQSRIMSSLSMEHRRFHQRDLHALAKNILQQPELDFWVMKAAQNLLRTISGSHSSLPQEIEKEFHVLPPWLKALGADSEPLLPWLPFCSAESQMHTPNNDGVEHLIYEQAIESETLLVADQIPNPVGPQIAFEPITPGPEVQATAAQLKTLLSGADSGDKIHSLADKICKLCDDSGDPMTILGLIEPWKLNDEMISPLLDYLLNRTGSYLWSSRVLCAVLLPKLLMLREPASRAVAAASVKHSKLYQRAAADAILFPLILRKEGINVPLCDILSKLIRECLHPAHVSSLFQRLLSVEIRERKEKLVCLPCHQCFISEELVWTEPLLTLLQNVLNQNVYLTQDAVDSVVSMVDEIAGRFAKSVKFGNFLICLVNKCRRELKFHKLGTGEGCRED